jgi:hypothetical protein
MPSTTKFLARTALLALVGAPLLSALALTVFFLVLGWLDPVGMGELARLMQEVR